MMAFDSEIKKLYYSISEVSKLTGLKQYVLRYWETEFSFLRPQKNRAGNRIYRQNDIDIILKIKDLLYDQKYTIEGARRQLKLEAQGETDSRDIPGEDKNRELLKRVKEELQEILKILTRE